MLIWTPPVWQAMFDLGVQGSSCSLISGLWCRPESAGPDGIRRGSPHLLLVLGGLAFIQALLPRGPTYNAINRISPTQPISDPVPCKFLAFFPVSAS